MISDNRSCMKDWKTGFFLIDRRAIPDYMPWRHLESVIIDLKPSAGSYDQSEVRRLTKMIAKDGTVSKFPGKFPGYTPSKEEEKEPEKKGSKEALEKGPNYEFLSYAVSDSDSDLESITRSGPKCNELEDTCKSGV
ncbi:hypothetical protein Tco_0645459 [Tanacetum coccineum]